MLDFKLEGLAYLEETIGPTVRIRVSNLDIDVPTSWHVLVVDRETYTVDTVPIPSVATFNHDIMMFSPDDSKLVTTQMTIVDYSQKSSVYHPMIPKGSAMIHPTGIELSHNKPICYGIIIGPFDLYRWVGNLAVGDILT
ncbi:MAG: hypothetical protein DDT31_00701 [Syntrophomonadaceae bacterium]|nr:hypothetical protein [Bacillota bacterium]